MKKYSYNEALEQGSEGNPNGWMPENNPIFQEDPYPFNQYFPPGMALDKDDYHREAADFQKDGKDFDDFKQLRKSRLKRLRRIKRMQKLKEIINENKKPVIQPTPFYSSMYGYTGFEGAMTSPLEYYSGSIMDEPGAITNNPYNDTYQGNSFSMASKKNERIQIRTMMLKDFIRKS